MKCLHMANSHLSINLESQEMLKPFRHDGRGRRGREKLEEKKEESEFVKEEKWRKGRH